jgi:RNA polymerase sigma factor (sigma-70 family)
MSAVGVVSPVACAPSSDAELVWAVRDGDDEAFEELFRRYESRIRSFVTRRVGDPGRGEDVTQDVFISALRRLRATESEIHFKPWLYEIARNATIDLHRARASRAEEVPVEGLELVGSGPPEAEVLAREQIAHLRGAFGELNEVQRRGLVMRELEGRSYSEIGERLQLTRPAVESVLFRARRRLAKEYRAIRARAAALLPFPAFGHGAQAGTPAAGEQAAALVTAVALAIAGGAALERTGSPSGPTPEAPAGAGAQPPQVRPYTRPAAPQRTPPPSASPKQAGPAKPAPAPRAAPRREHPAAPEARAPAEGDEPGGGSTGSSERPPVGLELSESAERPPTLPGAPTATQPLAAAPLPAVPLPPTKLPTAQLEGGVKPVVDAVKELARAG